MYHTNILRAPGNKFQQHKHDVLSFVEFWMEYMLLEQGKTFTGEIYITQLNHLDEKSQKRELIIIVGGDTRLLVPGILQHGNASITMQVLRPAKPVANNHEVLLHLRTHQSFLQTIVKCSLLTKLLTKASICI